MITVLADMADEESVYFIHVAFTDQNGAVVAPDSATWTLTDDAGTVVNSRENVSITTPESEETIVLAGNDLAILDGEDIEYRILTVSWTYTVATVQYSAKSDTGFLIRNLSGVT